MIEVEVKFPLTNPESFLLAVTSLLHVTFGPEIQEHDQFYSHPNRDFAKTDECLRIRSGSQGVFLTYKGRKDKTKVKSREELEFEIADETEATDELAAKWSTFWTRLDFFPAATVTKSRRFAHVCLEGTPVTLTFDHIASLGFFCELEVVVEKREDVPPARDLITRLARQLGLREPEERSYLELLTEKQEK
ncbi:MAG: class IV adenylate cyclase [Planctomycetia bacterium]|nr:class IV adenylate cyclase [Planctomycetia bacterium]